MILPRLKYFPGKIAEERGIKVGWYLLDESGNPIGKEPCSKPILLQKIREICLVLKGDVEVRLFVHSALESLKSLVNDESGNSALDSLLDLFAPSGNDADPVDVSPQPPPPQVGPRRRPQ